jgi:hypothetical protein
MSRRFFSRENLTSDLSILLYLSLFKLLLHFFTNHQYGYFRDELYYLECGERLDWGYADQSPLIAVIAKTARLMGDSLFAIRFFPAVAGAALVFLTGIITRELGGGRFAIILSAVLVLVAPYFIAISTILTMNVFEPFLWMGCAYTLIRIVKTDNQKLWLWFGLIAGVGLMNKHSMAFFGFALIAGLVVTRERKHLFSKWLLLGGLLAFLIFLPNILWQINHDWATLELLKNAQENQTYHATPLEFFSGQVLLLHPLTLPIWLAGLFYYLFSKDAKPYRFLGWTYLILFALMILLNGKAYYLAPVYPLLFAGGALVVERLARRPGWGWLKPAAVTLLIVGGAVIAPMALPVLPVETFIKYSTSLGLNEGVKTENLSLGKLPQHYADMFGWENMTAAVAQVYNSLPPEERAKCAIFASNYGEAGAIDFFGKKYNLPKSISGHQNYYFWGPRDYTGEIVITVGEDLEDVSKSFNQIELAATVTHEYAIPHENNLPIFICRQPKRPLKEIWPDTKCFSC